MTSHATIELCDLSIGYRQMKRTRIVASQLNATIWSGQLTCLIGSNGVGKSTLLRTIAAFQPKLGGALLVEGQEIQQYAAKELAQRISVVLTERLIMSNMTAYEMIALGRSLYTGFWGQMNESNRQVVDEAIELVGIQPLAKRMIDSLSDGERQKVMIAKALAQETPIILLDEPTAFLDFPSKVDMLQILLRLSREAHKTIFLSTHDLELALQIADQVWLLDDDHKLHMGPPRTLASDGTLPSYFAAKGIDFDPETLHFSIHASKV
ncbi:ABC transporter ATP-binding protein [uncultured Porphyromonas sp.]|uniref:ABC transporter ATP-binding protein n=1 Tax=uncultured Porphyromonas sp. TaxID=159274 RepID=UPI00344C2598